MAPVKPRSKKQRLIELRALLGELSESQFMWAERIIGQFRLKPDFYRDPNSDLILPCVLEAFGDVLQIHHCYSAEALSKDRFEYALERVLNGCGIPAQRARRGNPGYDLRIWDTQVSLKTQADKSIQREFLHISKFMELGKGKWATEEDVAGLRERFFRHMDSYERILQLRRLTATESFQEYELVEIPKSLLLRAATGHIEMKHDSRQDPKPAICNVIDNETGGRLFQLYFDAGSERKLQIKHLAKHNCIVHAQWGIKPVPITTSVA